MTRRMMALLALLLMGFGPGCGVFGIKERVVFVREDLTLDGKPRQILKTIEVIEADVTYFNGDEWIVVEDAEIPAGWLIVSPAVIKGDDDGR